MNNYDLKWWFTALIIGVSSNILTNYLIKKYSDIFAKYSRKFREHRIERVNQRNELIDLLVKNEFYMQYYYHKEIRYRFYASYTAILGLFLIACTFYINNIFKYSMISTIIFILVFTFACIFVYLTNFWYHKANEISDILIDAFKIKKTRDYD